MSRARIYCRSCGRDVPAGSLTDLCAPCFSGMNAPVDVLAVIGNAANVVSAGLGHLPVGERTADELDKARAAVAELMEAAKGARRYLRELADAGFGDDTPIKPLDAALAKFGGAA